MSQADSSWDDDTSRSLKLFVVLARCAASVQEHARRDIVRHRLSPSEFGVLEMLYHRGPTTLGEIAERILLTTGSLTYVVNQLEKRNLVRRVVCPEDRRVYYAELTAAGNELITEIFPTHADCIRKSVSALTAAEQRQAIQLLKKLGLGATEINEGAGHGGNAERFEQSIRSPDPNATL